MCHFFITGSSSDANCQSCLEPFTNTTFHVHMKGENLYLPIFVYLYCLGICASVFINTRRINPFLVCMCSELFLCGCAYLPAVLQYGVGGFVQSTLPQADKILDGTFPLPPALFPTALFQFSLVQNRRYFSSITKEKGVL